MFQPIRLPDGRSSPIDLSLLAIQPDPNGRHHLSERLDDEGGVHPRITKKRLLIDIGMSMLVGKVADDASETLIKSLSVAGARYLAWGSGAVFLLLRSRGAPVKLPAGTRLRFLVSNCSNSC
jgi:hypothetical protein